MNHQQETNAAIAERDAGAGLILAEKSTIEEATEIIRNATARIVALEADKAALLAALKAAVKQQSIRDMSGKDTADWYPQARAAIRSAEGRAHD